MEEPRGRASGGEGRDGRRAAAVGTPRAQRREGTWEGKGLLPVARPPRPDSGCSSRSPTNSRSAQGPAEEPDRLRSRRGSGQQGSAHPSPGPRGSGAASGAAGAAGPGAPRVPRGWEARPLSSPRDTGANRSLGRAGPRGKLDRSPSRPAGPGGERAVRAPASSPSGRCAFVSGAFPERGARRRLRRCGASRGRGPHTSRRKTGDSASSETGRPGKGSHSDLQARDLRGSGVRGLQPPRVELQRDLRRRRVPASQRGSAAPQCVSPRGPGPENRSSVPGNGGEDGQGLRSVRNRNPGGLLCSQSEAGCPRSALDLSHRRAGFAAALGPTEPG